MIIICAFYFIPDSGPCVTDKDCEQEIGYIVKCDTNTGFCVKILQRSWVLALAKELCNILYNRVLV